VQTLSRLNRAHPQKHDVFVLDFQNDSETITAAFAGLLPHDDPQRGDRPEQAARPEGRARWLRRSTRRSRCEPSSSSTLGGADRDKLDPILDACVAVYREQLDEDGQVDSRARPRRSPAPTASSRRSCRTRNAEWEKLSIFLNFLIPKLPAPKEEDLSKGILEAIDMDSYRVEKKALISSASIADLVPFERTTNPSDYYKTAVPLMTLEAAASSFGKVDPAEVREWVTLRTAQKLRDGMFVARVVGSSMEPQIPDGAYCLFAPVAGGSRRGRVLLVQHQDIADPETGGSYTVKRYDSDKVTEADGTWSHSEVRLQPANPKFDPIVLRVEAEDEVRPVAELVEVLR
jgi:SOS-response transcriptional repressor LexA